MNGWLLVYFVGVIVFYLLSIFISLYDSYRTNDCIKCSDLNEYGVV